MPKDYLVNITGGKDLKLFEVDEAVNKVRAEVDPEAELIIGAITDPALEGIMRVSIVATALDGQQPESKSVINMVHRIQNRNPGYFDSSSIHKNNAISSNNTNFISSTSGANALQVENEEIKNSENELLNSMIDENMAVNNISSKETTDIASNNIDSNTEIPLNLEEQLEATHDINNNENSNGLENFELGEESPQLFNYENENINEKIDESQELRTEEDELEIPAFLRRQKN